MFHISFILHQRNQIWHEPRLIHSATRDNDKSVGKSQRTAESLDKN